MDLHQAAQGAAESVRVRPGSRWFLATDTDADGVSAAAVAMVALRRAGHRVQVRASRDKTEEACRAVFSEPADGYVFLDKGSSHLPLLAEYGRRLGRPVLVLDHHGLRGDAEGVHLVNPRAVGLDGSRDACSATVAVAFALALGGKRNLDLAPLGLSGAIGDWQHRPRWQGWNEELVRRATEAGHVRAEPLPRLPGVTLGDALAHGRPPVPGLHGDREACEAFLRRLGVDPEAEVEELDREARTRLVSALALRHVADGDPAVVDGLVQETLWNVRLGTSLRHVFRIIDACGRDGHAAEGIAYLLGDRRAKEAALRRFRDCKHALRASLRRLREVGTEARRACQVHWAEHAPHTGVVGGLAVEEVLDELRVPLVVLARREDGDVQVSTRGTHALVGRGLDLAAAVGRAAASVGREGGGHPVAAGAVVAQDQVDAFLGALDEALLAQPWMDGP